MSKKKRLVIAYSVSLVFNVVFWLAFSHELRAPNSAQGEKPSVVARMKAMTIGVFHPLPPAQPPPAPPQQSAQSHAGLTDPNAPPDVSSSNAKPGSDDRGGAPSLRSNSNSIAASIRNRSSTASIGQKSATAQSNQLSASLPLNQSDQIQSPVEHSPLSAVRPLEAGSQTKVAPSAQSGDRMDQHSFARPSSPQSNSSESRKQSSSSPEKAPTPALPSSKPGASVSLSGSRNTAALADKPSSMSDKGKTAELASMQNLTRGSQDAADTLDQGGNDSENPDSKSVVQPPDKQKPVSDLVLKQIQMWSPKPGQRFNLATNLNITFDKNIQVIAGPPLTEDQIAQIEQLMRDQHLLQVKMNRRQAQNLADLRRQTTSKPKPPPPPPAKDRRYREAKRPVPKPQAPRHHAAPPHVQTAHMSSPRSPFIVSTWDTNMYRRWALRQNENESMESLGPINTRSPVPSERLNQKLSNDTTAAGGAGSEPHRAGSEVAGSGRQEDSAAGSGQSGNSNSTGHRGANGGTAAGGNESSSAGDRGNPQSEPAGPGSGQGSHNGTAAGGNASGSGKNGDAAGAEGSGQSGKPNTGGDQASGNGTAVDGNGSRYGKQGVVAAGGTQGGGQGTQKGSGTSGNNAGAVGAGKDQSAEMAGAGDPPGEADGDAVSVVEGEGGDGIGGNPASDEQNTRDDGFYGTGEATEEADLPSPPVPGHTVPGALVLPPSPPVGTSKGHDPIPHKVKLKFIPPPNTSSLADQIYKVTWTSRARTTKADNTNPKTATKVPVGERDKTGPKPVMIALTIGSVSSRGQIPMTVMDRPHLPMGTPYDVIDPRQPPAKGAPKSRVTTRMHVAVPAQTARPAEHPVEKPDPLPSAQPTTNLIRFAHNSFGIKEGTEHPIPPTPLPDSNSLIGDGSGLKGEYYEGPRFDRFVFSRADPKIDFDWITYPTQSPGAGIVAYSDYTVRWTGRIVAPYSETYTFYAAVDDGVRVWINHKLVLDGWSAHSLTQFSNQFTFRAGEQYLFKCEYLEIDGGGASVYLYWESPHTPKEFIPEDAFFYPLPSDEAALKQDVRPL
jgi:hypothetical protein